jgi:hypothetical protein
VEEKRAAISRTEIRDMAMEFAIFQTSVCWVARRTISRSVFYKAKRGEQQIYLVDTVMEFEG